MQGGMGDYTRELAREIRAWGIDVHVVTSVEASPSDACTVHPVIEAWSWHSLRTIDAVLGDLRPAIVHIQYQTAAYGMHPAINCLPLWLRLRRPGIRTAITYHDLRVPYLFPKAGRLRWWVTIAPACWCHAVIVTNTEDRNKLAGTPGLHMIPIGSNIHPQPPANFDPLAWRDAMGIARDEAMLVYFGFLNESKGGETLIHGLERLIRRGYNCRLVMLGGQVGASDPTNQAYLARVKALIERLGLVDRVLWTGFVADEQVSAYMLAADMAVLPYRDGASYRRGSLMAALAHGLPVVTTRPREQMLAGDLPQLVDGVNARLVPADAPDALAQAVADLLDDPALRWQIGRAARELSQAFTWNRIAARHKAVYDKITTAGVR